MMTYRSIQTLRGVAAMLVALLHIFFSYTDIIAKPLGAPEPKMATFYYFKCFGGSGMQIFFVISGFIMAYLHKIQETTKFFDFSIRRLTRIAPLYWIVTMFWAYVLFAPGTYSMSHILESIFFIPRPDNAPVVGPGWSLNLEMFFYALFGFVTLVCHCSLLWVAISFVIMNLFAELTGFYFFRLYSDPIVWNFVFGIAIYYMHRLPVIQRESVAIFLVGVTLLLSSIFWHLADSSFGIRQFLPWGVPSMFIVLGAVAMEAKGAGKRLFNSRIILELGNASYALYLTHSISIVFAHKMLYYEIKTNNLYIDPDVYAILLLVLCCLVSLVVHRFVEKPMTRMLRKLRYLPPPIIERKT